MYWFSLKNGECAVIHGDGSSRAGRSQLTHCNVWFSQGQINTIVPVSSIPAGADFCIVVPVWPSYIPKINILAMRTEAAIALLMMSMRPSMSRISRQKHVQAGIMRAAKLLLAKAHCPSMRMGKCICSTHGNSHSWRKEAPNHSCLSFVWGWTWECCSLDFPVPGTLWGLEGDAAAWAISSQGLLSMAR